MGIGRPTIIPLLCTLNESFNEHELAGLSRLGSIIEVPAGSLLTQEGAVGQEAVVIISGTAQVCREGKEVAIAGPSSILGEAALLTGETRNASLIAESDLVVNVLNGEQFELWVEESPRIKAYLDRLADERK